MSTLFPSFIAGQTDPGVPPVTAQVVYCSGSTTYRATPAEVVATGLAVNATYTNPTASPDSTNAYLAQLTVWMDGSITDPVFSNQSVLVLNSNIYGGVYTHDGVSKTSYYGGLLSMNGWGVGQRFGLRADGNFFGNGDAFGFFQELFCTGGCDASGDEGQGLLDLNWWGIADFDGSPTTATITVVTTSTLNTTLTQSVTKSRLPQTVSVGSTSGLTVGQPYWLTVDPQAPAGVSEGTMECIKATVIDSTHVSAVFTHNHNSGVSVRGATVLQTDSGYAIGQHRFFVNLSATPYTTGTAAGNSSNYTVTGAGTSWSTGMVGGTGTNIGAISFSADNVTSYPFSSGTPLRDWYPIASVASGTSLNLQHRSTAADNLQYTGRQTSAGTYTIRPGARIMAFDGTSRQVVVLPYNTFTWTVGDVLECAISPDQDVTAAIVRMGVWSTGAQARSIFRASNTGYQQIGSAYSTEVQSNIGSWKGFHVGYSAGGCDIGVSITDVGTQAIALSKGSSDATHIVWGDAASGNTGLYWDGAHNWLEIFLGSSGCTAQGSAGQGKLRLTSEAGSGGLDAFELGGHLTLTTTGGNGTVSPFLRLKDANNNHTCTLTGGATPSWSADRTLTLPDCTGTVGVRVSVPGSSAAAGAAGQWSSDDSFVYVYGLTGWRRVAASSF